jgi:hypothetical protein
MAGTEASRPDTAKSDRAALALITRGSAMGTLSPVQIALLNQARNFFVGHTEAVGVLLPPDNGVAMFIKSGIDGGPWGGTQRGGVPRMHGWGFTRGGPSQGNIATHVEGHASAILWQRRFRTALLLVDRPMCSVCGRNLAYTLPPGAELRVLSEEEGLTIVRASHG